MNDFSRHFSERWIVPAMTLALACVGLVLGLMSLATIAADGYVRAMLWLLTPAVIVLYLYRRRVLQRSDHTLIILAFLTAGAALALQWWPVYIYGPWIQGMVHRSFFSAVLLLGLSLSTTSAALYDLFGGTPKAQDLSRYPLLILPVILVLALYGLLLWQLVARGLPPLIKQPAVLVTPYDPYGLPGLRTHIAGTLLLIMMTAAISLPIGIGTGVYLAEYGGDSWFARLIGTAVTTLRSISVLILALVAASLVNGARGTVWAELICGKGDPGLGRGSFFTAAVFMSFLTIPIIVRVVEEGCRSLPRDLREGSWALGATEGYTLRRVILPWTLPNILTGLLLTCAETAGDMAVIMLMAQTRVPPVHPLRGVVALAPLIFEIRNRGPQAIHLREYQFSAALLVLLLAMGLTIAALILKNRFASRYRGSR